MTAAAQITLAEDGTAQVSGEIDFSTANALLQGGVECFAGRDALTFDFSGVTHSDSSALAFLLELLDQGGAAGVALTYRNIPPSLLGIARLSNAESLLV